MEKQRNDDIILHPIKGKGEKSLPAKGIFFVNPSEARVASQLLLKSGGEQRFLFHSSLVVSPSADFFVAGPALGAPMAAMTLEKLIALGAERVIMAGWCGAVDESCRVGDSVLGGVAYSGEGTSAYYGNRESVNPSSALVLELQTMIAAESATVNMWSTDAPYRESRAMLNALAKEYSVAAVDMEYSALCSVASFRRIQFAALFLVSDELWREEWRPGFSNKVFKKKSRLMVEQLIEMFTV